MTYNPDGDPDDFDDTDPEALSAWLDHPNTAALFEDLGRDFRAQPPAEQIAALARILPASVARRDDLAERLASEDSPQDDPRRLLLTACQDEVQGIAGRISELLGMLD